MPSHPRPSGALVTGASSGIGRATALAPRRAGLSPRAHRSRSPTRWRRSARSAGRAGGTSIDVAELDVRDDGAVRPGGRRCRRRFGPGLAVVHSAAVVAYGPVRGGARPR